MPTDPTPSAPADHATDGGRPDAGQDTGDPPSTPRVGRRDFLRATGGSVGLLAMGGCAPDAPSDVPGLAARRTVNAITGARSDVVVIGAGLWGSFAAYNLRRQGATVTLVDQYGPGNSRATSGDETRGVRSTYGERGESGELWMLWAREAMKRWAAIDEEWGKTYATQLYFRTGDLCFRPTEGSGIIRITREWYDKHQVPYTMESPDVVRREFPVFGIDDIVEILHEPDAGVVRARKACQSMATVLQRIGGRVVIGKAALVPGAGGALDGVTIEGGETLRGDNYLFALGPWMRTYFPTVLGNRMRTPLGVACYFGVPAGDSRFTFPNLPSYNFPGTTGWPTLPVDSRGFRVRGGLGGRGGGRGGGGGGGGGGRGGGGGGGGGRGAAAAPAAGRGTQAPPPPPDISPNGIPASQDPDYSSRWADDSRVQSARNFLAVRFPLLAEMPILETRACHYEQSSSRDFIVDRHPDFSNVWLAGGGNAEGAKFAPVIGDYISQRVLGVAGDPEVDARFKLPELTYDEPGEDDEE